MNVEQALCIRLFLKDVGYRNKTQQAALVQANQIIEGCAIAALLGSFQAPDTGHSEGQSIATKSEPGSAAAPSIPPTGAALQEIEGLLNRREKGDEAAGYQAFQLMLKAWPQLTADNATLAASVASLQGVIAAILADPHGCVFCDSGKLRNPSKDHDPMCGFGKAIACFPRAA